ncbi:hypothetical protein GEMRC1_008144 [Eukaryota sp. GEM-RC1]
MRKIFNSTTYSNTKLPNIENSGLILDSASLTGHKSGKFDIDGSIIPGLVTMGSEDNNVPIWSWSILPTQKFKFSLMTRVGNHSSLVNTAQFALIEDEVILITGSDDGTVRISKNKSHVGLFDHLV